MAITFAPRRGAILMCNFEMARVHPEMPKVRPVVVVSDSALNHRHARAAGVCVVVPFTSVPPDSDGDDEVIFVSGSYWTLPEDSWARCKLITTVSHDRLDLALRNNRRHPSEFMSDEDLDRVMAGVKAALLILD